MLKIIQIILGVLLIILIIPQTPTENIVLRKFADTGIFMNYAEARSFLNKSTWFLILTFLCITFLLNFL
jgi:protein translocase SecG subunit